ncbi:hypothetical protein PoB_001057100 [Plakobranchus ocellatus]|uniref:HTH psq-type domain-containing protein n=1 Tax=Plakobranchus ocellatus TaxID=259542 RepID=A0AAV3Y9Y0_9GAST|nr:hypothetical protein PoB_001057100 [Plakobranchus ocellatus]
MRDRKCSGRPLSASDTAHQEKVDCMIRANRRVKQKEIVNEVGISKEPYRHNYTGLPKSLCLLGPKTAHCRDESAGKGHVYSTLEALQCRRRSISATHSDWGRILGPPLRSRM